MRYKGVLLAIPMMFLVSCMVVNQARQETQMTQTQIREFQTRYYDTNDVKLVMKSVLNVLQDDGYIVKNAVVDLGLITATKEIDLARSKGKENEFWEQFFLALANSNRNEREIYQKLKQIEVSVNVSEYGKQTKVRANFQARVLDNTGNVIRTYAVEDAKFYQDFFAKVDKGIFLQKQGL